MTMMILEFRNRFFLLFLCLSLVSQAQSTIKVNLIVQPRSLPQRPNNTMEFSLTCTVKEESYRYRRYNQGTSSILTRVRILEEAGGYNKWQPIVQVSNMEPSRVYVDPAFPNVKSVGWISLNLLSRASSLSATWTGSTLEAVKRFRCDAITFNDDYSNSGSYHWDDTRIETINLNSHSLAQLSALEKASTLKKIETLSMGMNLVKPTENQNQNEAVNKEREQVGEMLRRIKTRLAEAQREQAKKIKMMTQTLNDLLTKALENQTREIGDVESQLDVALEGSFLMLWPGGTYALPQPSTGCPSTGGDNWQRGFRKHHTESVERNEDDVSPGNHLSQPVVSRSGDKFFVYQRFCVKLEENTFGPAWPKGSYCISPVSVCPAGFGWGKITWDDEDFRSEARVSGKLPLGRYQESKTEINYCCREDGIADEPIDMPRFQPFYLYRYGGKCQQVVGMNVTEEYIQFDTENSSNGDKTDGDHPDVEVNNLVLHLCFYEQA